MRLPAAQVVSLVIGDSTTSRCHNSSWSSTHSRSEWSAAPLLMLLDQLRDRLGLDVSMDTRIGAHQDLPRQLPKLTAEPVRERHAEAHLRPVEDLIRDDAAAAPTSRSPCR